MILDIQDASFEKLPFGIWQYSAVTFDTRQGIILSPYKSLCHNCAAQEPSIAIVGFSYDDTVCDYCSISTHTLNATENDE